MGKYNWIKAYHTTDTLEEKEIFVRQEVERSDTFVDDEGNRYNISELDLTRSDYEPQIFNYKEFEKRNEEINQQYQESQARYMEMLSKMDANSIADHKAKIDEREYWRKLRGDIALEIIRKRGDKGFFDKASHSVIIADMTKVLFDELYDQDKFFNNK